MPRAREIADGGNAVARYADIGPEPGVAGAVEHAAACDDVVEPLGLGEKRAGREQQGKDEAHGRIGKWADRGNLVTWMRQTGP
jgi:hypothetical protein